MRSIIFVLAAAFLFELQCSAAIAQKRFALLIGNQTYAPAVGVLTNPFNDIQIIQGALSNVGFKTTLVRDGNRSTIARAIVEFAALLDSGGDGAVGFLYYSGHGAARPRYNENYIIPVDVRDIKNDSFWYDAISLDSIVKDIQTTAPNSLTFVVFDACRSELHLPMKALSKGFEPMRQTNGIFIAFSTSPNDTATDAGSAGGPYAKALAAELVRKGQDQLTLFQNVKERVFSATGGQRPWENNGFVQRIYLGGMPAVEARLSPADDAEQAWLLISGSTDPSIFESFKKLYPKSPHFVDASKQIEILKNRLASDNFDRLPKAAQPPSKLALSVMTSSPVYSRGEIIKIKLVAASSYVKASAVFPFGSPTTSRVEASYNASEGGLYIPFKIPANAKAGQYSIPVYIQEIRSRLEERQTVELEIREQ